MARIRLAAALAAAFLVALPVRADPISSWSLQVPAEPAVSFRGLASMDDAGTGTGSMLYPAPNVAVAVAALITHGILSQSIKRDQKNKVQTAADQVLLPYRSLIDRLTHRDLMQRCLDKMATPGAKRMHEAAQTPAEEWVMESLPEFSMTQDQRALVLDNEVAFYRPGQSTKASYRKTIRIVSYPAAGTDLVAHWSAGDAPRLADESAAMLAESLDVALLDIAAGQGTPEAAFKTVRYLEGGAEKYERAQLLKERCDRILLRTLRGGLMSVPPKTAGDCTAPPR